MPHLTPIRLQDGTIIYIEAAEDMQVPAVQTEIIQEVTREVTRADVGGEAKGVKEIVSKVGSVVTKSDVAVQGFQSVGQTIHAYTRNTLDVFKEAALAEVQKVTLEFGITMGGEAGVPYVTKGTASCNLKITVECAFPDKTPN